MARSAGRTGAVYASPTGTGVAVPIGSLSAYTLDRTTDAIPVTAFGDLNKTYVQGLPDIKGTISGFWDSASDPLYTAGQSSDGTKLYLYPSSVTPTVYDAGPAWLNTSLNVSVDGAVTLSGSFIANGSWIHKP